jgi:hypothetical protein
MRRPGAASPQGKGVSPPAAGPQAGSRRPHLAVAPTGDEAINALLTTRTAHADAAAISLPDGKRGLEENPAVQRPEASLDPDAVERLSTRNQAPPRDLKLRLPRVRTDLCEPQRPDQH